MAINLYERTVMLAALEQMYPPRTFVRDSFFREEVRSNTLTVQYDIFKNKRRLAPMVHPTVQGKPVERIGFKTNIIQPPYVKFKKVVKPIDTLNRLPGEIIYGSDKGPDERARELLAKDLLEGMMEIDRREEWMACRALQDGKITLVGDGYDGVSDGSIVDFQQAEAHQIQLTGDNTWDKCTATTGPDVMKQLNAWRLRIMQDSGLMATDIIMSTTAWDYFLASKAYATLFEKWRVDRGEIVPEVGLDGVILQGTLRDVNCKVWVYNEWFTSDTDGKTLIPMIDPNRVMMISRGMRAGKYYGAIQDLEAYAAVPRYPKSWVEEDPSARILLIQSAPVMAPIQVDGWVSVLVK